MANLATRRPVHRNTAVNACQGSKVTEVLLPGLACGGCGTVTHAAPPPGSHPGSVAYGPVLNAAAVLLSCHGNVPAERAAQLIGMLTGEDVSAAAGAPHMLVVTTPDARLRLLLAMASRRKVHVGAGIPAAFTGHLIGIPN
jgi:hypothetical protein